MGLYGRLVRVIHWIAPALLPFLVVFGRGLFGAPMGWMAFIGVFISPLMVLGMYAAPIIVAFDRDAKAARSTRLFYNIASWVTWVAMLVMMFTLEDGGDGPPYGSVLSTWGWTSSLVASNIFAVALIIAFFGWVGTIVTAIFGVVRSRIRPSRPLPAGAPTGAPLQPGHPGTWPQPPAPPAPPAQSGPPPAPPLSAP